MKLSASELKRGVSSGDETAPREACPRPQGDQSIGDGRRFSSILGLMRIPARWAKGLGAAWTLAAVWLVPALAGTPISFEGSWSAPSLSQPATPLIFSLLPGGKATEQVGSYHGVGTWKLQGGVVKISWASEWAGLLRPSKQGGFELLTWKKGRSPDGPPDDIQPAQRVDAPAK